MTVSAALYSQAMAGNVFRGTIATASAIPINNTTSPTCILWNPSQSGVNVVMVRAHIGQVAVAGAVMTNIGLNLLNAGANIATGAPISAFTEVSSQNAIIGSGKVSRVRFGSAATLTTAGSVAMQLGLTQFANTSTAVFGAMQWVYDFDDTVILPPGMAIYDTAIAATVSTFNRTWVWYEIPVASSAPLPM